MQVYRETAEALRAQNPNLDSDQLQSPEFKKAVLEQLVSQKLLEAEAEKLGISVSNSELHTASVRFLLLLTKTANST